MSRLLVWPWHGLVRGSQVHLPNGETVSYSQPPGAVTYGSGDTHLVKVPDIAPITPEEAETAPPGGQYWAGQALITAGTLYNQSIGGWIFQAEDGTRWIVGIGAYSINAATSSVQLIFTRFGDFGVAAERFTRTLNVPVGLPDDTVRRKLFGDPGAAKNVSVRLHSVSASGRSAVLAWSLYPTAESQYESVTDTRPRAYTFCKVSLYRIEKVLSVSGEVLYSFDDVYAEERTETGGLYARFGNSGTAVEIDRKPIERDPDLGDTVTYNFSPTVEVINGPSGSWRGPGSLEVSRRWIIMVVFEGEDVRPYYLRCQDTYVRGAASFTLSTLSPMIIEEYKDGSSRTLQNGETSLSGGGYASGQGTITWDGPGSAWSRTNSYSVSSSLVNGELVITTADGDWTNVTNYGDTPFTMWTDLGASFGAYGGSLPYYAASAKQWSFVFYSNNLIAVTEYDDRGDQIQRVIGVITSKGYQNLGSQEVLPADMRHYGSYNPATEEFIILTPDKVNWV